MKPGNMVRFPMFRGEVIFGMLLEVKKPDAFHQDRVQFKVIQDGVVREYLQLESLVEVFLTI